MWRTPKSLSLYAGRTLFLDQLLNSEYIKALLLSLLAMRKYTLYNDKRGFHQLLIAIYATFEQ